MNTHDLNLFQLQVLELEETPKIADTQIVVKVSEVTKTLRVVVHAILVKKNSTQKKLQEKCFYIVCMVYASGAFCKIFALVQEISYDLNISMTH